jgi:hypothetical protein
MADHTQAKSLCFTKSPLSGIIYCGTVQYKSSVNLVTDRSAKGDFLRTAWIRLFVFSKKLPAII